MGRFADTHRIFYKKGEVIKFLSFHLFCKLAIILGQAIIETSKKKLDNCETPRKCELNYGKLTRAKENTGESPVLRRQERLISIRSVHLLHRPCESDSSVSKFLSAKQIINEFAKYCEE